MKTLIAPIAFSVTLLTAASPLALGFGFPGSNGSSGASGRDGYNGQDVTIAVDGQPHSYNLSGQRGEDGSYGESGQPASSCQQPMYVQENLFGANGGNGGRGGSGGDGGRGGDAIIHYNQLADLSLLTIYAAGAEGGRGSYGGQGAPGCGCQYRQWTVRKCIQVPNPTPPPAPGPGPHPGPGTHEECHDEYFSCQDGTPGINGGFGSEGSTGRIGSITLIQNPKVVTPDSPDQSVEVTQLARSPETLTENIWSQHGGALTLLGRGSVVSDRYTEFEEQLSVPVGLEWNASRPVSAFAGETVHLTLSGGSLSYDFPGLWQTSTLQNLGGHSIVVVDHAYKESEVGNVELTYLDNLGADLTARVTDLNSLNPLVPATFYVTYQTKTAVVFWKTRFAGPVPQDLVRLDGNRYLVNIGRLPLDPAFLHGAIRVTLTVHLELGGKSTEKTFTRTAKI